MSDGLEKCMSFILKHLVFIDSLQLLNSSLDTIKEKTFAQNRKIWGINFHEWRSLYFCKNKLTRKAQHIITKRMFRKFKFHIV